MHFSHLIISRLFFLMNFGSESGCLGLENQASGKGCIAKINFMQLPLFVVLSGLGTNFHAFCCPGEWFDI